MKLAMIQSNAKLNDIVRKHYDQIEQTKQAFPTLAMNQKTLELKEPIARPLPTASLTFKDKILHMFLSP